MDFTLFIIGSILLETIRVIGVLKPMNLISDRYWLEITSNHITCVLAQISTDRLIVLLPSFALSTKGIDT